MTTSRYIHGTTPVEQERLSLLNRLQNERCLEALALAPGERVLDLGCGLAQLSCAMARAVSPGGRVVGIEREPAQLAKGRALAAQLGDAIELRSGDVLAPPIERAEWGSFDVAHTRFVLEHLPEPAALVDVMVRAVRPGGRIVLMDDDHELLRLWPSAPELEELWQAYFESYRTIGNDPLVGRKLVALLVAAGAEPVRCRLLDYSACQGQASFAGAFENLVGVVEGAREAILAGGFSPQRFDRALAALRAWSKRPDASLWYAFSWAEGRRPR